MVNSLYWISALVYALVLILALIESKRANSKVQSDRAFRTLLAWVIWFCLQDAVWGLCGSGIIHNDTAFFISSMVFHGSTVVTTYFWMKFILIYLDDKAKYKNLALLIDRLIIISQYIIIALNFVYPLIFRIIDGIYYTYPLRFVVFANQYVIYLSIGIVALFRFFKSDANFRYKYRNVFWFVAAPILSGVFQYIYPNGPFYSMGYFLGCVIVYVFIVNKNREEASVLLGDNTRITMALSTMYYAVYKVDLISEKATMILAPKYHVEELKDVNDLDRIVEIIDENFVDREYSEVMKDFDDYRKWNERLADKTTISMEYLGPKEGWSRANIVVSKRDDSGQVTEVIYAVQQINDQKVREEAILKNLKDALAMAREASNVKTSFLFNMSHDIRTPMNAVVNYTKLAIEEPDVPEKVHLYLSNIQNAGNHLMSLINSVLDMSRIESGKLSLEETPCNIRELAEEIKDIILVNVKEKNQELLIDLKGIIHENILCDRLRFNQIMINIIGNAVKFTDIGGRIVFRAYEDKSVIDERSVYHFSIIDNGVGIDSEFIKHIFEPFEREATSTVSGVQGTGLGLAITRNLVEMMGGNISVKSKKGEGSEFLIDIPFSLIKDDIKDKTSHGKEDDSFNEEVLSDLNVLIAEDNMVNILIAKELLSKRVNNLEIAKNGKEAIDILLEKEPGFFDIILMDIQMPEMDGYEATAIIRNMEDKRLSEIPIIAMTANAFEEDKRNAKNAGMNGHISKPIDLDIMLKTIWECINK